MKHLPLCRSKIKSEVSKSLKRICTSKQTQSFSTTTKGEWTMYQTGINKNNNESEWDRLIKLSKEGEHLKERWGVEHLIGIDEAGRGCWAGPVAAAAASIPIQTLIEGVRDSKLLSEKARTQILDIVFRNPDILTAVDLRLPAEIDSSNILHQTRLAMSTSSEILLSAIQKKYPSSKVGIIIDGKSILSSPTRITPKSSEGVLHGVPAAEIVSGDLFHLEISMASIVAKTVRDGCVLRISDDFPEYQFHKHRAYGTKLHRENLFKFGAINNIHRSSYRPMSGMENWRD